MLVEETRSLNKADRVKSLFYRGFFVCKVVVCKGGLFSPFFVREKSVGDN